MQTLTEDTITSRFMKATVDLERLTECACRKVGTPYGVEYVVYSSAILRNSRLAKLFAISDSIKKDMEEKKVNLDVHIYIRNSKINLCEIRRYHEHLGLNAYYRRLECMQSDLSLARRILRYITNT